MDKGCGGVRRWPFLVIACVIAASITTGCYDRSELEEQAFVVTLGIDHPAPGRVEVTGRIAIPSKLGGQGGGQGGASSADIAKGTATVSGSGRDIHEALALMNGGVERVLNLSHLAAIIFSRRAAEQGLLEDLGTLVRYREFRRTLFVFISLPPIADVLAENRPVLESSVTREIEGLQLTTRRTGLTPTVQLHAFTGAIEAPGIDPIAPTLAINPDGGKSGTKGGAQGSSGHTSYAPGRMSRKGGNPLEFVGTAVFRSDRMVDVLDGTQTKYLLLLRNELNRLVVTTALAHRPGEQVTAAVHGVHPPRVTVRLGSRPRIRIEQELEAELIGDRGGVDVMDARVRQEVERAIRRQITAAELAVLRRTMRRDRADVALLFQSARGNFATFAEMRAYPWRKELARAQVHIVMRVTVRRLGTQLNPPAPG